MYIVKKIKLLLILFLSWLRIMFYLTITMENVIHSVFFFSYFRENGTLFHMTLLLRHSIDNFMFSFIFLDLMNLRLVCEHLKPLSNIFIFLGKNNAPTHFLSNDGTFPKFPHLCRKRCALTQSISRF